MSLSVVTNEDNMAMMARYPDKFFDLAIVDPPYGINIAKRNGSIGQKKGQGKITRYKSKEWDSAIPNADYWQELFRVSKNQIVWGGNYFSEFLPPSMSWVIWDKRQPEGVTFAMAELAWTSFNESVKMFSVSRAKMQNCVSNNAKIGKVYAKIHPTQKPVDLYKWLLKRYGKEGDKVLDTHIGSQNSRIAAHDMGFDFYGCEADEDYFADGCASFERHIQQLTIFQL